MSRSLYIDCWMFLSGIFFPLGVSPPLIHQVLASLLARWLLRSWMKIEQRERKCTICQRVEVAGSSRLDLQVERLSQNKAASFTQKCFVSASQPSFHVDTWVEICNCKAGWTCRCERGDVSCLGFRAPFPQIQWDLFEAFVRSLLLITLSCNVRQAPPFFPIRKKSNYSGANWIQSYN